MISKITGGATSLIFSGKILNKYDVRYYRCQQTGFIQTEKPYWLEEAYSSAITQLDIGLPSRNEYLRDRIIPIINSHFDNSKRFLDYAGGYGLFTRMMRDKGFDFYHTDLYCQNIFAQYFDLKDIDNTTNFEVITAFEVFEHLENPLNEIQNILNMGNNLLFTTELQPQMQFTSTEDWWYFIPETGQHISLFTEDALQFIADKLGCYFYTDHKSIHLFTKKPLSHNPFIEKKSPYLIRTMQRKVNRYFSKNNPKKESLLQKDWNYIKNKI